MNLTAVPDSSRMPDLSHMGRVDEVGVKERVARFQSRSIKKESKIEALHMVLSMIDLTTLEGQDTPGKVKQLSQKAIHLHDSLPGLPHVAAVCVYPTMVGVAKRRADTQWQSDTEQNPYLIQDTQELKTTWHPIGS